MPSSRPRKRPTLERVNWELGRRNLQQFQDPTPGLFLRNFCQIYDVGSRGWIPFRLWPAQEQALNLIDTNKLAVALKARQLGFSWLVVGYALWTMMFRPVATVLIFSKRDDEAKELLNYRLKGMHQRLPDWLRPSITATGNTEHSFQLANGSRAMAFPNTGGRSYTASLAIVDEADYVPDLAELINSVKPTIDAGGKLVLLSTVDKSKPLSYFKRVYQASKAKQNSYASIFIPWYARPERSPEWYEEQKRDKLSATGTLDDLWQEYPATDTEALAPRVLDKRIPPAWLEQCFVEKEAVDLTDILTPSANEMIYRQSLEQNATGRAPALAHLTVYQPPVFQSDGSARRYVIGADPAEGNPTSDDSSATVLDVDTGEEVAVLCGKIDTAAFARDIDQLGRWYFHCPVMVERNNHGHAVILWLQENSPLRLLNGTDNKPGWLTTTKGKPMLFDACADAFCHKEVLIHTFATFTQLSLIEGTTLKAPEGMHDDRALSVALAIQGVLACVRNAGTPRAGEDSLIARMPADIFDPVPGISTEGSVWELIQRMDL